MKLCYFKSTELCSGSMDPVMAYSIFWKFLDMLPVNRRPLLLQGAMEQLCKSIQILLHIWLSCIRHCTQQLVQFMLQLDLRVLLFQLLELSRARWSSLVSTHLQQPVLQLITDVHTPVITN